MGMYFSESWVIGLVPSEPRCMFLRGQISKIPIISKCAFAVFLVGTIIASRIILRQWKPAKSSNMTDWVDAMVQVPSYLLNRFRGRRDCK